MSENRGVRIRIENVWKSYGAQTVLKGVSLDIEPGETLVILGGSGQGKSVLIRQIIGLETPDDGAVHLDGMTATEYGVMPFEEKPFHISMVFQSGALLNSLTVGENVSLSLREHRMKSPAEVREIVRECLEQVDLAGTEDKLPSQLSGGMRKRAAIARALAIDSQVILYDEPTGELDPILNEQIGLLIRMIQRERHPTQVVVTHNLPLARMVGDRVAVLEEGEIVDINTGDDFFHSKHEQTKRLVEASQIRQA